MNENKPIETALIVGAGGAGQELMDEFSRNKRLASLYDFVGFVDDDPNKQNTQLNGLHVLGGINDIPIILGQHDVKTIFIALPSTSGEVISRVINQSQGHPVKFRIVPRISEIVNGSIDLGQVREIQVEDLLGRAIVRHDFSEAKKILNDKTVMILGAAGSIGSELATQMVGNSPHCLVCVDVHENGMFYLQERLTKIMEQLHFEPSVDVHFIIGNIKDNAKMEALFVRFKPDMIFNAAAYKHVPLMENNSSEGVLNNIQGTQFLFELSLNYDPETFVLISSDKAVNPTNIMGATKRVTEKLMHVYSRKSSRTRFSAVRFGNVLNSNGSVIPTFKQQIEEGVVTVTHPDIVRYFMTVQEAAQLVIQCSVMSEGDEIFVLDMGQPVRIQDLARQMIRLSGKEPGVDVEIQFIGLRPGEKLYEETLTEVEETTATKNQKIFIIKHNESFIKEAFMKDVNALIELCNSHPLDETPVREALKKLVPTFMDTTLTT